MSSGESDGYEASKLLALGREEVAYPYETVAYWRKRAEEAEMEFADCWHEGDRLRAELKVLKAQNVANIEIKIEPE